MGRWSQRRRSGGGPNPATQTPIWMISARFEHGTALQIQYSGPLEIADFIDEIFIASPGDFDGENPIKVAIDTIEVEFGENITSATEVEYDGASPKFVTPQVIPIT